MALVKASLMSIVKILLKEKYPFTVEVADSWNNGSVIKLTTSKGYTNHSAFCSQKSESDNCSKEKRLTDGDVLLFFNLDENEIIGMSQIVYNIFKSRIKDSKKEKVTTDVKTP